MGNTLLIRADASVKMGTGHFMRCLALGQAWKDAGGQVIFITTCSNEGLLQRLYDEGFVVHRLECPNPDPQDLKVTKQILDRYRGAWIVLDGYHFDSDYQRKLKKTGHKLLVIDDMAHLPHYYADIILNQNLHAENLQYSCEPYTTLLLGTKYVLLRREFLRWKGWKRKVPKIAKKILVTLGGSDPENITLKIIQALQKINTSDLEVTVVIGANNPHADTLEEANRQSRIPVHLVRNVKNMPELMAWADVAISSAGTTVWELAFMGVPNLALILAENQRPIAEELQRSGCAINLGWHSNLSFSEIAEHLMSLLMDQEQRAVMTQTGQQVVDGGGTNRVLSQLGIKILRLRPVHEKDCWLLWNWANDPYVRKSAFSSDPIPWENHVRWFNNKLNDSNCIIFIAEDQQGTPIGQIRFETKEEEAEIDVSVVQSKRGLGYGALLIKQGVNEIFQNTTVTTIHAFIKLENIKSIRSFEKAGFKYKGVKIVKGTKAKHYVMVRENGAK